MESLLIHYLTSYQIIAYGAILLGMFLEGESVFFAVIYLDQQGILDIKKSIIFVALGIFFGDLLWYRIGYSLKSLALFRHKLKFIKPLDQRLEKSPYSTIFISKFTYGLHHLTLVLAGSKKINFKKFIKTELITIFCWLIIIGNLGFLLSSSLENCKRYFHNAEVGLLIGVIIVAAVVYAFSFLGKKVIKSNSNDIVIKKDKWIN